MLRHYLLVAWRTFRRQRLAAALNVGVLSLAIAYAFLALTYVRQELTFDGFHRKGDRIFLVEQRFRAFGGRQVVRSPAELGPRLAALSPSIVRAVRICNPLLRVGCTLETSDEWVSVFLADPELLQVFDFPLVAGSATPLTAGASSVLVTQSAARRYFLQDNPIGQELRIFTKRYARASGFVVPTIEPHVFTVVGVLRDVPANSSLQFDVLAPYAAGAILATDGTQALFVELAPGTRAAVAQAAISRLPGGSGFALQPLRELHFSEQYQRDQLGNNPTGRLSHVSVLAGMAMLVLAVASLAYANLSTAQQLRRVREVGVRKAVGASRRQLLVQFCGESVVLALVATVVGLCLALVGADWFGGLVERRLDSGGDWTGDLASALGLGLGTGLVAGWYPALALARARPAELFRGMPMSTPRGSLARGLMVAQLALSIFLVVCVVVMGAQLLSLLHRDLGFDSDHVVAVDLQNNADPKLVQAFRDRLEGLRGVVAVSAAEECPGLAFNSATWTHDGRELHFNGFRVDATFLDAMGLRLVSGRWLDPAVDGVDEAVVVNEAFVRQLGADAVVGQRLPELPRPGESATRSPTVVGVVGDFHFTDIRRSIGPVVVELEGTARGKFGLGYRYLLVRLDPEHQAAGLTAVERTWKLLACDVPFVHHRLRERLDTYHADTVRWTRLVRWSALLAMAISGLAVYGMAQQEARRRTREIGIRKALGGSVGRLAVMLVWQFARLALLANLLAWPAAYLAMRWWLRGFAYAVPLAPQHFLLAGALALALAAGAAAWHSVQAARANPAQTLRCPE